MRAWRLACRLRRLLADQTRRRAYSHYAPPATRGAGAVVAAVVPCAHAAWRRRRCAACGWWWRSGRHAGHDTVATAQRAASSSSLSSSFVATTRTTTTDCRADGGSGSCHVDVEDDATLRYDGYSTTRVRALKRCVLDAAATTAQLREAAAALERELHDVRARVGTRVAADNVDDAHDVRAPVAEATAMVVVVCERDVHHVRYLLGLAYRRLGRFADAERVHLDIVAQSPHNVDAVESLLELYAGLDDMHKLRQLLDRLAAAPTVQRGHGSDNNSENNNNSSSRNNSNNNNNSNHNIDGDTIRATVAADILPLDMAMQLLVSLLLDTAARTCQEHGEGAMSRYVADVLAHFAAHLGTNYMAHLLHTLLRQLDEQLFSVRCDAREATREQRQLLLSVLAGTLKALLTHVKTTTTTTRGAQPAAAQLAQPLHFRFVALTALYTALRAASRTREAARAAEQLLQLYRSHSTRHRARMRAKSPQTTYSHDTNKDDDDNSDAVSTRGDRNNDLSVFDDTYMQVYLDYVEDMAQLTPQRGEALCRAAAREYPASARPWLLLALAHRRRNTAPARSDAITAAEHALQLEPCNLAVLALLCELYSMTNQHDAYMRTVQRYDEVQATRD